MMQSTPHAFKVNFSELVRWDPNSFHQIKWHWPSQVMRPIGSFLKKRKEKINKSQQSFNELMPITIHFDGSVRPRDVAEDKEYTMELFKAYPGDIVASKIDLKNGAVTVVPDGWENVVVTNHFAVYEPDLEIIDPLYFHLLIQAPFFKKHLWRNKVGAEGRKEVKLDFLESLEVPVPDIKIQKQILKFWNDAKNERERAENIWNNTIDNLNNYLIKQTNSFDQITHSKIFLAHYQNAMQWDTKAGRAAAFISANPNFIRLGDHTEECLEAIKPWEDPEKEWPIYGVSNKEGIFLSSMQQGNEFNAAYKKIEKGWFFHNPTRANVGSLGIVPDVPEDAITSPEYQVWKLKGGFLPEFMALLLRTDYFLALVAFNRVGGVKQRMYYANLAEIRLPEIPEKIQKEYAQKRQDIIQKIAEANKLLEQRKIEVEQMILGTLPIGVN